MDYLWPWAVPIAGVAVGLSPGLAIVSAGSIARLLHLALAKSAAMRSGKWTQVWTQTRRYAQEPAETRVDDRTS